LNDWNNALIIRRDEKAGGVIEKKLKSEGGSEKGRVNTRNKAPFDTQEKQ
jgi:hypothetical protein